MLRYYFTLRCGCKNIRFIKKYCTKASATNRQIFSDLLGVSREEAKFYIDKHRLNNKDSELLAQSIQYCQSLGFTDEDILITPNLLRVHPTELEHHYLALEEGGFNCITAFVLSKSRTYMRRVVDHLKEKNLIPKSVNVPEMLVSFIEDETLAKNIQKNYKDNDLWSDIHLEILKSFLRIRLNGTKDEIENLIFVHKHVRNKSFRVIQENIKMAESLGFEPRKMIKYGYLLANKPSYTKTTLQDLGNLAGMDMKVSMRRYPKLVTTDPRNIIRIYGILKEFDLPDEIIRKQPNIFHMAPETVKVRLQEIEKSPDLNVLLRHPNILALVVHHNRAKTRLSFLQSSQLRCAAISVLKTDYDHYFEEYVKEGKDVNKINDLLHYLEKLFSVKREELKKKVCSHPYHLMVPLKEMQKTYDYLISHNFSPSNIYKTIYILLYPMSKVRNSLTTIKYDVNYRYRSLSQLNKLNLILYLMEREHHFTGNGIWKDHKIPEFVEKSSQ